MSRPVWYASLQKKLLGRYILQCSALFFNILRKYVGMRCNKIVYDWLSYWPDNLYTCLSVKGIMFRKVT